MTRPSLYLPLARWKREESMLTADTEFVLDGLERSANTFAVVAFQLAQNGHVRLAHHMHAAAPFLDAVRRGVPALITVREPEGTIVSAMMRQPHVTPRQWLKTYAAYFARLMAIRHGLVIATFSEVTTDFGTVIRRVNDRFGTGFKEFQHTDENVRTVFGLIDERAEGPPWQPSFNRFASGYESADEYFRATSAFRGASWEGQRLVHEHRVGRPSPHREARMPDVLERYRAPSLTGLRERAEQTYEMFVRGREQ